MNSACFCLLGTGSWSRRGVWRSLRLLRAAGRCWGGRLWCWVKVLISWETTWLSCFWYCWMQLWRSLAIWSCSNPGLSQALQSFYHGLGPFYQTKSTLSIFSKTTVWLPRTSGFLISICCTAATSEFNFDNFLPRVEDLECGARTATFSYVSGFGRVGSQCLKATTKWIACPPELSLPTLYHLSRANF